jgi:hypothetical protein
MMESGTCPIDRLFDMSCIPAALAPNLLPMVMMASCISSMPAIRCLGISSGELLLVGSSQTVSRPVFISPRSQNGKEIDSPRSCPMRRLIPLYLDL